MPIDIDRGKVRNSYLVSAEVVDDIRAALRRGLVTEKAICKYADCHWVEFHAAMKILQHRKEVVLKSPTPRYQGIVERCMSYRKRRRLGDLDQWRNIRGRPKRQLTGGSLQHTWQLLLRGYPINWLGLRYFRMNHEKRKEQRERRLKKRNLREKRNNEPTSFV